MAYTGVKFLATLLVVNGLQCHVLDPRSENGSCVDKVNTCFRNSLDMSLDRFMDRISFNITTGMIEPLCNTLDWVKSCVNDESCDAELRLIFSPADVICEHRVDILDDPECWGMDKLSTAEHICRVSVTPSDDLCSYVLKMVNCIRRRFTQFPECSERSNEFVYALSDEYLSRICSRQ